MTSLSNIFSHPLARTLTGALLLVGAAWLAFAVSRTVLRRITRSVSQRTETSWDDALIQRGVFHRLALAVPLIVIQKGLLLVPNVPPPVEQQVANVVLVLLVAVAWITTSAALSALNDVYERSPRGHEYSIKGYIQLIKIGLSFVAAILVFATILGQSPWSLLAGLGAISAVLLLIFKDTILSVIASIQIGTNDMLRVGDWIALPEDNVDGDVIEIALHTVKVVNWDKTISTVPTWHFISHSFRNYRNMYETGRRIRRALNIDLTSVRFHSSEEIDHLRQFTLMTDYFTRKESELRVWNAAQGEAGQSPLNQRRLSNLGSFRAYMQALIASHPGVNQDLFWAVRQLDPGPTGIPLQVYGYTRETGFVAHHGIKDDIFDHLIAILPEFGLSLYQQPSSTDIRAALIAHES